MPSPCATPIATGGRTGREVQGRLAVQMGPETRVTISRKSRIINTKSGRAERAWFPESGNRQRGPGAGIDRGRNRRDAARIPDGHL